MCTYVSVNSVTRCEQTVTHTNYAKMSTRAVLNDLNKVLNERRDL